MLSAKHEAGLLKFEVHGADVSGELIARLKANLARLEEIIDGIGSDNA